MRTVFPPSHDSIFGDTYRGVVNPLVPHRSPYPTRFHGPIYNVPGVARLPYVQTPYLQQPMPTGTSGFGADSTPACLFAHITGSPVFDAVVGAGLGYFVAEKGSSQPSWAVAGAFAAYLAGTAGILGLVGAALWARKNK